MFFGVKETKEVVGGVGEFVVGQGREIEMKGALQEGCDECPLVVGGEGLEGLEESLDGGGHGVWVRMWVAGCETSEVLETSEVWVGVGVVVGRVWVETALRLRSVLTFRLRSTLIGAELREELLGEGMVGEFGGAIGGDYLL